MTETLWLTIDWREADADLPETAQEQVTEALFRELAGVDGVEQVERVADPAAPEGGMGAAWLWSILQAEVTGANAIKAVKAVKERLPRQPLSFTLKVGKDGEQEVSATNVSPDQFEEVLNKLVAKARELKD